MPPPSAVAFAFVTPPRLLSSFPLSWSFRFRRHTALPDITPDAAALPLA